MVMYLVIALLAVVGLYGLTRRRSSSSSTWTQYVVGIKKVCAWCQAETGIPTRSTVVSHGICPRCDRRVRQETPSVYRRGTDVQCMGNKYDAWAGSPDTDKYYARMHGEEAQ